MAYQSPQLELVRDNLLRIFHPRLLSPSSYLTADVAASATSLTVANNDGFADNDPVLLEGFGQPLAEIKDVTASPTYGTAISVSALTFAHGNNTPVFRLPFDKVEVSGTNTSGGSKTVIAVVDINPTAPYTEYVIAATTYSYYYVRFYNSFAGTPFYGEYSDEIEATDFGMRTVGGIRRMAFGNLGVIYGEGGFTQDWIYDVIYQCESDVLKIKDSWGEMVVLDYDLGSVTTGMPRIALPSNIDLSKSNRSILGLRIATGSNLDFLDWKTFQQIMDGTAYTTLATTAAIGAVTLVLTDSSDFDDSGTVTVDEVDYAYTANNRSTNTLSGLTALSAEITAGSHIWQNATFGEPDAFVVKDGYIYFSTPFTSDLENRTIWLDYFKTAVRPNSDGDIVSFSDAMLYVKYLEMAIKKRKANGEIALTDESLLKFNDIKQQLAMRDKPVYTTRLVPDVPLVMPRANSRYL